MSVNVVLFDVKGQVSRAHLTNNGIGRLGPLHDVCLGVVVVM